MKFRKTSCSKMLTTLGIICVLLSINVQSCESSVVDGPEFKHKDLDTPTVLKNNCEMKNNTYFICCVEYKALICIEGQYLPKDIGIEVAVIINHKIIWQETVSETNPPELCALKIPEIGELCFKFYDVQLKDYHFCLNMTVKLDIIHKIKLKKIHLGCFDGKKEIPKPLKNCTVSNLTESSFNLYCQQDEERADNKFWLEVIDSKDLFVENETTITPNFVVSDLHPGTTYFVTVFITNKFGNSLPATFNITTIEKPNIGKLMKNAVVNIYLMYTMLPLVALIITGFVLSIVLKKPWVQKSNKSFAQMKDELAYKLLPEDNEKACSSMIFE